ncbi:hypothetical protein I4641_03130 [Waterburya agarophytonicola K14]|uniref:Uncharacterized protein n=1 Tax=Waterburya agarophytonicola KI4 TaxID=2874699 RepID=A0A964BP81_9CYAN|nr:hypothetical protein [Waterburya agarophytonicola]MCC0175973.1 hypothetical protein [Waterburya agarophytonicola KI4]
MSQSTELNLEQIRLSLSDYQSELNAIDLETIKEKERILDAIKAEEAEIKLLLDRYRDIKRQKEIEVVKSSYNNLAEFKQTLLSKIQLETEETENQNSLLPTMEGGEPKKNKKQLEEERTINQKVKVIELIQFIDDMGDRGLVKLYPADVASVVPNFEIGNTIVRDELLKYYQKNNIAIYNSLLKLYQKPQIDPALPMPDQETLSLKDRGYHSFLEEHYPKALPFFWYLINREADSIRYAVMEFAVDHIIQTNTVENDPDRQKLNLKLSELLEMNNQASLGDFLKDLFLCFHPRRVSQKSTSKNKYFDYVNNLIKTESTLENSEVLQIWNHFLESGYERVSSPDFITITSEKNSSRDRTLNLIPTGKDNLL